MNQRRVCLFGGTFDPIHNAHLKIASEAQEKFAVDPILFVPAANPPHKASSSLTDYEHRFRMVELACAPFPGFEASRLEHGQERSYTIDTICRFQTELEPQDELYFLIGADAFGDVQTWRSWQQVLRLVTFIVASRPGEQYDIPAGAKILRLDGLQLPVASSTIRSRLIAGESTPELPTAVRSYIEQHELYGWKNVVRS
jgi:nicotinate-nucleotide adenylyltransferase